MKGPFSIFFKPFIPKSNVRFEQTFEMYVIALSLLNFALHSM